MPLTATIINDPDPTRRRRVKIAIADDDGHITTISPSIAANVPDLQAVADASAVRLQGKHRKKELNNLIERCIAGEDPDTIERVRVTKPKLWETMTRRLHNGPKRNLSAEDMRGLAQWVVNRATPAIRTDLKGNRTIAEVNALKVEWQALLDVSLTEYDEIEEED